MKSEDSNEAKKDSLSSIYGPLIGCKDLIHVLEYKTPSAFRRALRLNRLIIHTFTIEDRRGQFAYCAEVEEWLKNLKTENKL